MKARIVAAAVELTTTLGWSSLTMARLAEHVGVSRQTVYNEVGSKPALAEAMVLEELSRFLAVVEASFDRHPADLDAALRGAVHGVLVLARDNALLRAIVSPGIGGAAELLPPLTTYATTVLSAATAVLSHRLEPYAAYVVADAPRRAAAIDAIVRLVLSHVMQPGGTVEHMTDNLTAIAAQLLGATARSGSGQPRIREPLGS